MIGRYELDSETRCAAKQSFPAPFLYFTHTDSIVKAESTPHTNTKPSLPPSPHFDVYFKFKLKEKPFLIVKSVCVTKQPCGFSLKRKNNFFGSSVNDETFAKIESLGFAIVVEHLL